MAFRLHLLDDGLLVLSAESLGAEHKEHAMEEIPLSNLVPLHRHPAWKTTKSYGSKEKKMRWIGSQGHGWVVLVVAWRFETEQRYAFGFGFSFVRGSNRRNRTEYPPR